jgi:hypothetical protein
MERIRSDTIPFYSRYRHTPVKVADEMVYSFDFYRDSFCVHDFNILSPRCFILRTTSRQPESCFQGVTKPCVSLMQSLCATAMSSMVMDCHCEGTTCLTAQSALENGECRHSRGLSGAATKLQIERSKSFKCCQSCGDRLRRSVM